MTAAPGALPEGKTAGEETPAPPPDPVKVELNARDGNDGVISGFVAQQTIYQYGERLKGETPVISLREELSPKLPQSLHPFRAPNHGKLLEILDERRIVLLMSYRERAAFAAGHALVHDPQFKSKKKRALFPTRRRDKSRVDLDLMTLTEKDFLDDDQILLIELDNKCTFLESVMAAGDGVLSTVCDKLEHHSSYIVLSVDERLLDDEEVAEQIGGFSPQAISHLLYLLSPHYAAHATDWESKFRDLLGPLATKQDQRQYYQRIADYLARGTAEFERFLQELDTTMHLAPELRTSRLRTVEPSVICKSDSEVHKAAAFVAACFPEINQKDFDEFVRLLLGKQTTTKEDVRQGLRRDGKLITVREKKEELCTDQWTRDADKIFADCHLRTVVSGDGSWIVDFCEPYLRDELRSYLDQHHPWYVRRQCERLQKSGVLFYADISPKAIEGLVQLFIERAIVDPTAFGSSWLLQFVVSGRAALAGAGEIPDAMDAMLEWLAEKLIEQHIRDRFQERLSILIREMLDRDEIRSVVREFFELLIASKEHDALLDVILDLAPRLRFVPGFDPLTWMKRLLDQGSKAVQGRTIPRVIDLARRSGPQIYEFLSTIHDWLPESDREPDRYSLSNAVAIDFPFHYCAEMAKRVTPGVWPSQHPLFYALSDDDTEVRTKLSWLIDWIIDARGAIFVKPDASDPLKSAEAGRMGLVADLVEHWAWVLEGPPSQTPPPEGQTLLCVTLEQLDSKLNPRERMWLQRSWQRRQEEHAKEAATKSGDERKSLIARKTKLEQLRMRYFSLTSVPKIPVQGATAS